MVIGVLSLSCNLLRVCNTLVIYVIYFMFMMSLLHPYVFTIDAMYPGVIVSYGSDSVKGTIRNDNMLWSDVRSFYSYVFG